MADPSVAADVQRQMRNLNALLAALGAHAAVALEQARLIEAFVDNQRTFRYTSAGHESPVLYRAAITRFEALDSTGMPLGVLGEMDFPEGQMVYLRQGDVLLLTTDGVFEAMNEQHEQMGRERVQQVLADCHEHSAEEIALDLQAHAYAFMGKAQQGDDITIVTIKAVSGEPGEDGESGPTAEDEVDFEETEGAEG